MKHAHTIINISYISIFLIVSGIVYTWFHEWQEVEALEVGNQQIDEFRKEVNHIHIRLIEFSLLGEIVLDWNEADLANYHAQRIALDSTLCLFNKIHSIERIDSVRSLLEDKERQMFQIVRLMDEQQSINRKIASQAPVIVHKIVQEQPKKPKRKGFLGISAKKRKQSRRQQRLRSVHPIEIWSANRKSRAVDCRNKPTVLLPAMQNLIDNYKDSSVK